MVIVNLENILTIVAPLITAILAFLLGKYFYNKSRLIAYYGYISVHKVTPPEGNEIELGTHSIVIRNSGKLPARNVRLDHKILPDYKIIPNVKYEISDIPDGGKELLFPILVPSEQVTITYIYFPPLTYGDVNTQIKSDEGLAKIINVIPTQSLNKLQMRLAYLLLFIGSSTTIYLLSIFAVSLYKCCIIKY